MDDVEIGPIYGIALIDSLPLDDGMRQAMPSRRDLDDVYSHSQRTVAGYEVLLEHYKRGQAEIERLKTLVRDTRRQLWRSEVDNNPFTDDDEIPAVWNELTEKQIQDCRLTAAKAEEERNIKAVKG